MIVERVVLAADGEVDARGKVDVIGDEERVLMRVFGEQNGPGR